MKRGIIGAGLMALAAAASAQPKQSADKGVTLDDAYTMVENSCVGQAGTVWITEPQKAQLRKEFVLSDRLVTRDTEKRITEATASMEACLLEKWNRLVATQTTDGARQQMTDFTTRRSTDFRLRQSQKIRDLYASLGYRASSAAPGPRYGLCEINDDYEQNGRYFEHHYVSRVFVDRDPENEIAGGMEAGIMMSPQTAAGKRVLTAMAAWAKVRYIAPQERDTMECRFYPTAQEAQAEWEAIKAEKTGSGSGYGWIDTGIADAAGRR